MIEKLEDGRERLARPELLESMKSFLGDLIHQVGLDLQFSCEMEEGGIHVRLEGPDSSQVRADSARLLYAINHLLNQIFFRRSEDGCNFWVDCEGYRSEREQELALLSKKAAEQVRLSGQDFSFQPFPASERRIIHLALADEPGVRTQSEGTGTHRCVVVLPSY